MHILFFTPQLPYPTQQGTTIRNFNIIKHLAVRHEISLVSFGTDEELENAEPLRTLCRQITIAPYPTRSLTQRVRTVLTSALPDMALRLKSVEMHRIAEQTRHEAQFDIVQIEGIEMARYGNAGNRASRTAPVPYRTPAVVFDDHNAEYVLQRTAFQSDVRRPSKWHGALYSLIQWKRLEDYERRVCLSADHVVACSKADADAVRDLLKTGTREGHRMTPITIIPNGVDTNHFVPSDEVCAKPLANLALVFAGKMDYRPNIDAMTWFCAEILPLIRVEIPLAHIVIVGQKPAPRITALASQPGVQITGWVQDTRPYVADAAVYVVPLRMGSGTRLKVLEAMAMGKAIVSTSRGVEGIKLGAGQEAVVADTPEEFSRAVIELLKNEGRRRILGQAARRLAASAYDWRNIVPLFGQIYDGLVPDRDALKVKS